MKRRSRSERRSWLGPRLSLAGALVAGRRWSVRLFWAGLLSAFLWAALEVRRQVAGGERFQLDGWNLCLADPPAWVTPEIQAEIERIVLEDANGDPLSVLASGVLARARRAVAASPWVRAVTDIRLRYPTHDAPAVLEADVVLREPVALVEVPAGGGGSLYYLVDAEARRLGAPYRASPREWFQVPLITGARGEPPAGIVPVPPEGERWEARDVREGVAVARVLVEEGLHTGFPDRPILRVDVSNVGGRLDPRSSEIVLLAAGQELHWGRSPLSPEARTLSLGLTLEHLARVLSDPATRAYRIVRLDTPRLVGVR